MNVVHSGNTFQIYGDSLKTYEALPVGTYDVCFSKFTGFSLQSRNDLTVNEEKVYGPSEQKVKKTLDSFERVDRNFGVILSGRKGIGKSLFARLLAVNAKERSIPMLIVKEYYPGIADFLSSIEQEVIVLFDEFEKTFRIGDGNGGAQDELLSMFDGLDGGKKLFVITCNEVRQLSSYLLNRPGRFHYHFILGNPTAEEVREYMSDKLDKQYHHLIPDVVGFSLNAEVTYDILRAIAFELNNGYSFEETLADLNITKDTSPKFKVIAEFSDGSVRIADGVSINTYSNEHIYMWLYGKTVGKSSNPFSFGCDDDKIRIEFDPKDIVLDTEHGCITIDPGLIECWVDEGNFDMNIAEDKKQYEYLTALDLVNIVIERKDNSRNGKYMR